MSVELWTKPNCPNCDRTQMMLEQRGIDYSIRSFIEEPQLLDEAKARGFASAPVVIADDDAWCGLRPDKIVTL